MTTRTLARMSSYTRSLLVAIAAFLACFAASHARADAALHVCNATLEPTTVAIAVLQPGKTSTQSESEGWFQIDAQTCTTVIDTPLDPQSAYYLFAKSKTFAWAGSPNASTRDVQFCTNESARFFYIDRPQPQCAGVGEQMTWFINESVQPPDWTINLYSP